MASIGIKLDPSKMNNPDLDLRYIIPNKIEELTKGAVEDDGYDYSSDGTNSIIIFLSCENPKKYVNGVLNILRNEDFLNNNIYEVGVVAIDNGDGFKVIHPSNYEGEFDL
ncbi:hypothetical protein [Clostridium tagluense]|uniref:hypothetical protein n=1 Tax=Clostridium tagluense TaxID=360422 RepID=UPI001CF1B1E3|nr:hypothetical protein [Clostridium tagluense]MCB2296670.1 hypothetical protein [Clostridium tagluense]